MSRLDLLSISLADCMDVATSGEIQALARASDSRLAINLVSFCLRFSSPIACAGREDVGVGRPLKGVWRVARIDNVEVQKLAADLGARGFYFLFLDRSGKPVEELNFDR